MNNNYTHSAAFKDFDNESPRLKSACNSCLGQTKHCKFCGALLNWVDGKPTEYADGSYHRCPGRPTILNER